MDMICLFSLHYYISNPYSVSVGWCRWFYHKNLFSVKSFIIIVFSLCQYAQRLAIILLHLILSKTRDKSADVFLFHCLKLRSHNIRWLPGSLSPTNISCIISYRMCYLSFRNVWQKYEHFLSLTAFLTSLPMAIR